MQITVTVGHRSFNVESGPHRRFWRRVNRGDWEPETFAIFDQNINRDTLFVDIGAWIGSTSLYGAQLAHFCVAFEPDPVAFAELSRNWAANAEAEWIERLKIQECAINKDGRSFILGGTSEGADSTSSALFPNRESQWTVQALQLHDVLDEHRKPGQPVFLKIDIEGSEYELLPAVRDILADPLVTAYISFHPKMLRRSLAAVGEDGIWKEEFLDRHAAIMECLPWERWIGTRNGNEVSRYLVERGLHTHMAFPEELLIR